MSDRPLHPDDARELLEGLRKRRREVEARHEALTADLVTGVREARRAGLAMTDIAARLDTTRNTAYRLLGDKP